MNFIAVDMGWSGAIAWAIPEKNLLGVKPCPGDASGILRMLGRLKRRHGNDWYACIEANTPTPRFGAKGNFGLGLNIGTWEAAFTFCSIPYENINPKTWQKLISNEKSRRKKGREAIKERSWRFARRRFPELAEQLGEDVPSVRSPKQGMADALVILEWIRRNHGI